MIIGITGGIGSGKTTVARAVEAMGYRVFYSDVEAKRIIVEDKQVREAMQALLGNDIYDGDTYRTDIVAARIFSNNEMLSRVNAIVHPAVGRAIMQCTDDPLFVESAILYESGLDRLCRCVIAVVAPAEIRIGRVMQRDNTTREKVLQRMSRQMSDETLSAKADLTLTNDGTRDVEILAKEIITFCKNK